ncbi:cupin domain-containing protein [Acetobacteraceae bacterium ESL0709]|nr:cupin domain-containing protein [Acetobacteraceae bacterium ESL0697]MDF7677986.1 cupin domain-containing protein [Acetobacteraceae bacterium ESL0709]
MASLLDKFPRFLLPKEMGSFEVSNLEFEPISSAGRQGSSLAWLFRSKEPDGCAAAIIRYAAGGEQPLHQHHGCEVVYILEGEMQTSQGMLRKGDLALYPTESSHASSTRVGCLALIIWQNFNVKRAS